MHGSWIISFANSVFHKLHTYFFNVTFFIIFHEDCPNYFNDSFLLTQGHLSAMLSSINVSRRSSYVTKGVMSWCIQFMWTRPGKGSVTCSHHYFSVSPVLVDVLIPGKHVQCIIFRSYNGFTLPSVYQGWFSLRLG